MLWRSGATDAEGNRIPVDPAHTGRFTEDEWLNMNEAARDEIRHGTASWPTAFGAPFIDANGNGHYDANVSALPAFPDDMPFMIGDEAVWTLTSDGITTDRLRMGLPGIGLHFRHMAWAHAGEGCPEWVLFQRLRIVNTTGRHLRDAHIGFHAEIALGDPSDDLVGFDSTLGFAYFHNASDTDDFFGNPPAAGYLLLQGPAVPDPSATGLFDLSLRKGIRNLPVSAFTYFSKSGEYQSLPDTTGPAFPPAMRHALIGNRTDGAPQRDPGSYMETRFAAAGNPLLGMGWIDGAHADPGHRVLLFSTGPFDLAPGDTQEVILGRFAVQGGPTVLEDLVEVLDYAQCVAAHYMAQFVTSAEMPDALPSMQRAVTLGVPWPQPFVSTTHRGLTVPVTLTAPAAVTLTLSDILGRERYTQTYGKMPSGSMALSLALPPRLGSGVYVLAAETGTAREVRVVVVQ